MEKFRIKKPAESINKTIRMPIDLIEQIEKLAAAADVSFNQAIIQCCVFALKNQEGVRV